MADIDPFADVPAGSSSPSQTRGESADPSEITDLLVPSVDELWPAGADTRSAPSTTKSTSDAPRGFVRPRPFPLAPPIRPLSFTTEDSVPQASAIDPIPATASTHDARESDERAAPHHARVEDAIVEDMPAASPSERPPATTKYGGSRADQLVRLAAARGASALYLWSHTRPSIRIDGEFHVLDTMPIFTPGQIDTLLISLRFAHGADTREALEANEWRFDVPEVGEVRCTRLQDHRGPAALFSIPPRPATVATTVSADIQALAAHRDGLMLVAGATSSGNQAMIARMVQLLTRTRHPYVIWMQRDALNGAADRDSPLVSRREARGSLDELLAGARAALREKPDVLVLEDVRTEPLMTLALDAASSGVLVIAGFTGPTGVGTIERIVDLYPHEQSRTVQLALAQCLRAVIGQVLVPNKDGGRAAAQEVLLNTAAVATLLAAGKARQLQVAVDAGRKHGIVTLGDALVDLVRSGDVRAADAYRHAPDQTAFLDALTRHGIDTSFAYSS
jgi:twitching motility protein PilT